jgi:dolichol-phosphate mannosyltransferase
VTAARLNLIRWLKFNAVGAIGICVQLAVLASLRSGLGWNYLLSTAFAVEVTIIHNFCWHERFTWSDRFTDSRLGRFAAFNLSNGAISLLGNIGTMKLLAGVFGMNYFLANVIAIAAYSLLNFAVGDRFVFTNADRQPQST